jgi:hypothetical protein
MNDDNKNNSDQNDDNDDFDSFEDAFEDDFGLEETETTDTEHETGENDSEETAVERPAKKSGNTLPIIIGITVLCFLGWKLFDTLRGSSSEPPLEEEVVVVAQPQITQVAEPVIKPETAPAPQTTIEAIVQPAPAVNQEVTQVQTQMAAQEKLYQQKIQQLEKDIVTAKQSADTASRVVLDLKQEITSLTGAVQELSDQLDNLQDKQERETLRRQQNKTIKPKPAASSADKSPALSVYAIIPGRAWLRNPNGKTITVTEGDTIAEYGKVLKIDASSGIVITTSGVTLR